MKKHNDSSFFDTLIRAPWWLSTIFGVVTTVIIFLSPYLHLPDAAINQYVSALDTAIHTPEVLNLGWAFVLLFMLASVLSSCRELWKAWKGW